MYTYTPIQFHIIDEDSIIGDTKILTNFQYFSKVSYPSEELITFLTTSKVNVIKNSKTEIIKFNWRLRNPKWLLLYLHNKKLYKNTQSYWLLGGQKLLN